ncbi:hypothetical protein BC629DRAFT_1440486 [Irpex lacteus]|nr:hypothetical protein BC629DRAFT_1440486 [Irpex lacteus]
MTGTDTLVCFFQSIQVLLAGMPSRRSTAPKQQRKRNVPFRFNDLPSEILTEIFIAWSRVDENAPWTAASTCRHWRSVALASGQIWSCMTLTLECTQTKKYEWSSEEKDFAFVTYRTWRYHSPTLWIERSKQAPLSVQILAHSFNAKAMFAIQNVVSALRGHLPRLRRLTLSVATPDLATTFLEMLFRRGGASGKAPHAYRGNWRICGRMSPHIANLICNTWI